MEEKETKPTKLEDCEPGASKEEVMTALTKATKPISKPEK